ncbi:MAG: hypothetical protein OXH66_16235 [Gemmatimonadetes bacterium]|nr:hypothetical protein [Gemmatimonadota bacterium]
MGTIIAAAIAATAAVVGWIYNGRQTRLARIRENKEVKYGQLLRYSKGFFESNRNADDIDDFISVYREAWLYCPDRVIKAINTFLDLVTDTANQSSDERKLKAHAQIVTAMRRDLLGIDKTNLIGADFRQLTAVRDQLLIPRTSSTDSDRTVKGLKEEPPNDT